MEAPEAAADATGALAALQEDKLVDLTASMKLASRSLEPPGTASSLSLSDAGNEPPAGGLVNAEWAFYSKRPGPKAAAPVSKPTKGEVSKIKAWQAEKAAIRDRANKAAAAKQAQADAEAAKQAEEKLAVKRQHIMDRQNLHKQDMHSRSAYFSQVEQGYQEYKQQRSRQEPLFKKMQKAFKARDEVAEQAKMEQYQKTLQPAKLRTVKEIRKGVAPAAAPAAATRKPGQKEGVPTSRGKEPKAGKDEVPAMMSRACSPMVFLSTDRSPHEAGLTPDPSQAGPQVFDLEAEQTEQTTAEASRMDSELGPQASDEAAELEEDLSANAPAEDPTEEQEASPDGEASAAAADSHGPQQDQDQESDTADDEALNEPSMATAQEASQASEAQDDEVQQDPAQDHDQQQDEDRTSEEGQQQQEAAGEEEPAQAEPRAEHAKAPEDPEAEGTESAQPQDSAPEEGPVAAPDADLAMESAMEVPLASVSAPAAEASVPAEPSSTQEGAPEAKEAVAEEETTAEAEADKAQNPEEAPEAPTSGAGVDAPQDNGTAPGPKKPEEASAPSQDAAEPASQPPPQPAGGAMQASPFSGAAGLSRLGSQGRNASVSQGTFLAAMSNSMADLERQYSGLQTTASGAPIPYQAGTPPQAPPQEDKEAAAAGAPALRTTGSSKLLGRMSRASSNLVGRMFPARQSGNQEEESTETRPTVVPRVPSLNLSRISRG